MTVRGQIPYIITWSAERPLPTIVVERPWSGIAYLDETPGDRDGNGVLWLIRDYRGDWPGWPEHMAATEPPVCLPCARRSVRVCPALREGHVAVRVGHSTIAGVYGARYQTGHPRPAAVEDAVVAFDDPAIGWTRASQLVRELRDCTILDRNAM